uniref:hypothetical protein n=1 Tax=Nonomuraea sp. CA-251285 TaxID=3240002 RepID=UPI003F492160
MARHRVALPISLGAGFMSLAALQIALELLGPPLVTFGVAGILAALTWLLIADRP